ncbi:MAG: hypothetical protein HC800_20850, partial [Phormidesmis sp. RL_2_1]|nr:hypothetical protein [Phormidesmis sp. RL_2_1]
MLSDAFAPSHNLAPQSADERSGQMPLRWLLVVPFVVQTFAAVGLTGYISWRNGQKAVETLASQLQNSVNNEVDQHLSTYLSEPQKMVYLAGKQLERGLLNPQDLQGLGQHFYDQIQEFPDFAYISFGSRTGEFVGVGVGIDLLPDKAYLDIVELSHLGTYDEYALNEQGDPTEKLF